MNQLQWRSLTPIDAVLQRKQQLSAAGTTTTPAAPASVVTALTTTGTTETVKVSIPALWPGAPTLTLVQEKSLGISGYVWPAVCTYVLHSIGCSVCCDGFGWNLNQSAALCCVGLDWVSSLLFTRRLTNPITSQALVLIKYLCRSDLFPPSFWRTQRVIELGSGTGVVGLVCAWRGARLVTLTDIPANTELLEANVKLNVPPRYTNAADAKQQSSGGGSESKTYAVNPLQRVAVVDHWWGSSTDRLMKACAQAPPPEPESQPTTTSASASAEKEKEKEKDCFYDVVIASEPLYKPDYLEELKQSLAALVTDKTVGCVASCAVLCDT
jgi:predicted nicotinamide N-methyase